MAYISFLKVALSVSITMPLRVTVSLNSMVFLSLKIRSIFSVLGIVSDNFDKGNIKIDWL